MGDVARRRAEDGGPVRGTEADTRPYALLTPKELGRAGEDLAARYLEDRGYRIIDRGYRCPAGEADIIAYDELSDRIVLAEVKTRRLKSARMQVFPEEAVDGRKRARYHRIAACYAMDHFPTCAIRFDVVGIRIVQGELEGIEHLEAAFDWDAAL